MLVEIREFILTLGPALSKEEFTHPSETVWIAKDAKVSPTASILGPCIIDHGAEIRHCAFLRENVIIGRNAVVGNSVEVKNSILFDEVETPHFNYVGDSILGYRAHMGAGSILSNVKANRNPIAVRDAENSPETNLLKFGAILGDHAEIGCNAVLNPGCIVGRNANVYPLSSVRGVVPANSIYKNKSEIIGKK